MKPASMKNLFSRLRGLLLFLSAIALLTLLAMTTSKP